MFFLFFYYIFNKLFKSFNDFFVVNKIIFKLFFYIKKVINLFFKKLILFDFSSIYLNSILIWSLLSSLTAFIVIKISFFFSIILTYVFSFNIKYQLFVYAESKYDPYFIVKIIDFFFFYPIFYLYYYFFNDLFFSFQRIYFWFVYKINSFGVSQNARNKFMHYWSYQSIKDEWKKRSAYSFYQSMSKVLNKAWKSGTEHFPFIPNFQYYLFFFILILILLYFIYKIYVRDLKPIKYDADDTIRYDFFRTISDQTLKIEINDYLNDRLEKKVNSLKKYPLDYVNKNEIEENINKPKNSFDLIMNKFGIDGLSYLDEIRTSKKDINNYSSFNYLNFFLLFLKDTLSILTTFIKYQYKFNLIIKSKSNFIFDYKKKKKDIPLKNKDFFFFLIYMFFFSICYIYLIICVFFYFFVVIDVQLFFSMYKSYVIPYGIDFKFCLLFL